MPTKIFITDKRGYCLVGDDRAIMVSKEREADVLEWCKENNITAVSDSREAVYFGMNLWRVEDEGQRVLFILRWL